MKNYRNPDETEKKKKKIEKIAEFDYSSLYTFVYIIPKES